MFRLNCNFPVLTNHKTLTCPMVKTCVKSHHDTLLGIYFNLIFAETISQ